MKEKYVRTEEIESEINENVLDVADAFMSIFGFKRVNKSIPTQERCPIIPDNIDYYEGRIARRMHWDEVEKLKFFGNLLAINENCYISMMLKEISRKMYGEKGFILENINENIYMINLNNMEPIPAIFKDIHNSDYAIFKNKKDANLAIQIVAKKFVNESK